MHELAAETLKALPSVKRPARPKKVAVYPMDEYHSKVIGAALSNVWNSVAPDLDAAENGAIRKWSSKKVIETCLDYLSTDHLAQDDGLGHIAVTCLIEEHGLAKVVTWLAKEHPLGY